MYVACYPTSSTLNVHSNFCSCFHPYYSLCKRNLSLALDHSLSLSSLSFQSYFTPGVKRVLNSSSQYHQGNLLFISLAKARFTSFLLHFFSRMGASSKQPFSVVAATFLFFLVLLLASHTGLSMYIPDSPPSLFPFSQK